VPALRKKIARKAGTRKTVRRKSSNTSTRARAKAPGRAVLLIGAGRMGGALLKGWLSAKRFSAIHVIEPNPSPSLKALARAKKIRLSSGFDAKLPKLAAVVLATKPQVLKTQGDLLRQLGATGALILSIAAGVTTAFLKTHAGPHLSLVRAMPNTPGAIGRGITALYAFGLSPQHRALAESLTSSLGEILWVDDEGLMDPVTAVSGSGPAYVFLLVEALALAGERQGLDPATSMRLARATVTGAGALLEADARTAAELRKEVTSPGGTTEAALNILMSDGGLNLLMDRAVTSATSRSKALGSS